MYSTLLVLITNFCERKADHSELGIVPFDVGPHDYLDGLTMMKRGDTNMEIMEATLRYPTKICRERKSGNCKLTNTTARKNISTDMLSPNIFSCSSHQEIGKSHAEAAEHISTEQCLDEKLFDRSACNGCNRLDRS